MDLKKFEYKTVNVTLLKNLTQNEEKIDLPNGKVVRMGVVLKGNASDRVVNAGVYDSNTEIIRPADVSFLEKTTGGNFMDSFMPVDIDGGRQFQARLSVPVVSTTDDLTAQFMFIIQKPGF